MATGTSEQARHEERRGFAAALPSVGGRIEERRGFAAALQALAAAVEPFVVIDDAEHLSGLGADAVITGEREIARGMIAHIGSARRRPDGSIIPGTAPVEGRAMK